jgi:hypothetical protein
MARRANFRKIETWYNGKRRHSTLGYVSPVAYEEQLEAAAKDLSLTRPLNRGKLIMISNHLRTATLRRLQHGLIGQLALIACMSLLAAPTARAEAFDQFPQLTKIVKKIKHELGKRPAPTPAPATPGGTQSGSVTPASGSSNVGPVAVAQKVVGPLELGSDAGISDAANGMVLPAYTVSLHGSHLATVRMKGSRYVVTVDGVDGPRIDAILTSYDSLSNNSMGTAEAVVMSDDGRHYAYLARVGAKIEVVEDGRIILQFPRNAYAFPYHLVFSPHAGAQLLFVAQSKTDENAVLWVNGQPAPAYFPTPPGQDPIVTFSADGRHYLYLGAPALGSSQRVLVVDGKKQSYSVEGFMQAQFTADGRHVLVVTSGGAGKTPDDQVLLDGKPAVTAETIDGLVTAPTGSSYAAVVDNDSHSRYAVYLNGKEVPGTGGRMSGGGTDFRQPVPRFSPDGQHLAVACNYGAGKAYVVLDGKQGETYDKIHVGKAESDPSAMKFSSDSKRFGYFADAGSQSFAVIDGHEYDKGFNSPGEIHFSAEGDHVAVIGEKADVSGGVLYIDGKLVFTAAGGISGSFVFDRDGSHWMLEGPQPVVDGQSLPVEGGFGLFSPDGSEVAAAGEYRTQYWGLFLYNTSTRRLRLLTKGTILGYNSGAVSSANADENTHRVVFSPDSKHLYYAARGVNQQQHASIYVDGEKTAMQFDPGNFPPSGTFASAQKAGCWYVSADDKLHALIAVNNEVERIIMTPPPGSL